MYYTNCDCICGLTNEKKKIKNILLIVNIYQESVKNIPNIPIPLTIETSCVFKHLFGHIRTPLHIYLLHLEAESGCEAGGFVMSKSKVYNLYFSRWMTNKATLK